MTDIFERRKDHSQKKLAQLTERSRDTLADIELDNLAVFAVGSYGRHEASVHSDIDLFFVYSGATTEASKTSEFRLFGRLIDIAADLEFPKFSNDSLYLESHLVSDVIRTLGTPLDDHSNRFTMRMLMLLESEAIFGHEVFAEARRLVVETYFRDYPRHAEQFRPWFLQNDIMRFWKTLLLNYENRRNREGVGSDADPGLSAKARVKNFKLKFSRALTCFASIAAIASLGDEATVDAIAEICTLTPLERLDRVADRVPSTRTVVDEVRASYAWFLEQTELSTSELEALFDSRQARVEMFERADAFGGTLYRLLEVVDGEHPRTLRALVV